MWALSRCVLGRPPRWYRSSIAAWALTFPSRLGRPTRRRRYQRRLYLRWRRKALRSHMGSPAHQTELSASRSRAVDEQAYCVPRDNCAEIWPGVAKMIEEAYKFADENVPPDTLDQLRSGHRQLWVVWDGRTVLSAALTRINVQRSGLACQIAACGGTQGDRWIHLIKRIEDWAKARSEEHTSELQ